MVENLSEECPIVVQKAELINYTIQYLAEKIYKQICRRCCLVPSVLLIKECEVPEINWGKICSAKRTRTWQFGKFSAYPAVKDVNNRRFTVRKACSREKTQGMAEQYLACAEKIKHVTHGCPQPFQQKPGLEMKLSTIYPWMTLLSNGINLQTYVREL